MTGQSVKIRLWIIVALVLLTGGWMAFDGAHALVTGDFVTPSSGEYAGQLGPWAAIPRFLGIDPRSLGVRLLFLVFGVSYLAALVAFLRTSRAAMLAVFAAFALLYLPFGTMTSIVVLILLASLRRASVRGAQLVAPHD